MKAVARALLLLALAGLLAPGPAAAIRVRVDFAGQVSDVPSELGGLFALLDPVSGSFVFDTGIADTNPSPELGEYVGTPDSVFFTFGAATWTAPGGGGGDSTLVRDEPGQDGLSVNVLSPAGPTTNGYAASNLGWSAHDDDGLTWAGDSFPTAFDSGDLPAALAQISFQRSGFPTRAVFANVTFTAPEPDATAEALAAAVALAACAHGAGGRHRVGSSVKSPSAFSRRTLARAASAG